MGNGNEFTVEEKVGGGSRMYNEIGKSMKKNSDQAISASGSGLNAMSASTRATSIAWISTKASGIRKCFMARPYSGRHGTEKQRPAATAHARTSRAAATMCPFHLFGRASLMIGAKMTARLR